MPPPLRPHRPALFLRRCPTGSCTRCIRMCLLALAGRGPAARLQNHVHGQLVVNGPVHGVVGALRAGVDQHVGPRLEQPPRPRRVAGRKQAGVVCARAPPAAAAAHAGVFGRGVMGPSEHRLGKRAASQHTGPAEKADCMGRLPPGPERCTHQGGLTHCLGCVRSAAARAAATGPPTGQARVVDGPKGVVDEQAGDMQVGRQEHGTAQQQDGTERRGAARHNNIRPVTKQAPAACPAGPGGPPRGSGSLWR